MLRNYSEFVSNSSAVVEDCLGISSNFTSAFLSKCELKSICFVVISAALAAARNRPHFKERLPARLASSLFKR